MGVTNSQSSDVIHLFLVTSYLWFKNLSCSNWKKKILDAARIATQNPSCKLIYNWKNLSYKFIRYINHDAVPLVLDLNKH
jgi:hypothetical protein